MHIKRRIIEACTELINQRGLYRVTMAEIAAHSGVSKRTLYSRFDSKDTLIETVVDCLMNQIVGEIELIIREELSPVEFINAVLNCLLKNGQPLLSNSCLQDLRVHYPDLWTRIDTLRSVRVRQFIEARNPLTSPVSLEVCSAVVIAALQAVLTPEFILDHNMTFEEAAKELSTLLVDCISVLSCG